MKLALHFLTHIYVFKELKVNKVYKTVINVENKCVYQ